MEWLSASMGVVTVVGASVYVGAHIWFRAKRRYVMELQRQLKESEEVNHGREKR